MTKQREIEKIKKLVSKKIDANVFHVKYKDECYRIDRHGIFESNDPDPKLQDFTDKCQDQGHFERLKRHVLARITNNRQAPDFGFVYLTDVVDWHDTPDHKAVAGTIYVLIPE